MYPLSTTFVLIEDPIVGASSKGVLVPVFLPVWLVVESPLPSSPYHKSETLHSYGAEVLLSQFHCILGRKWHQLPSFLFLLPLAFSTVVRG